ncbi:hypothetical protein BZL54_17285 [Burkholderia ubonensis subsp. mesacidophila]|uniref:Uncharacterized protein n=1 Tax=Burkholderia ubonensis subsp. mesacidophila TaxID=265293 RepID=A0A2A4FC77_9BURK|nr:hypothetical protein BZL54_17285 [Burkholderia ubonensis subsp. mesacidophila]
MSKNVVGLQRFFRWLALQIIEFVDKEKYSLAEAIISVVCLKLLNKEIDNSGEKHDRLIVRKLIRIEVSFHACFALAVHQAFYKVSKLA